MSLWSSLPSALRRRTVAVLVSALAISVPSVVVTWSSAASDSEEIAPVSASAKHSGPTVARRDAQVSQRGANTLLVIGDSITSRFNDKRGAKNQGFWSILADSVGAKPKTYAQGGAGFVNPGLVRCKGYNFSQQVARPAVREMVIAAGALVIEGGRNDTRTCVKGGYADVSNAKLKRAVNSFMRQIRALRGRDDCTIVLLPWGPRGEENRDRITPIIRKAARKQGFTFVNTMGLITKQRALADKVHPNRAGNVALSKRILAKSFARACFY